MISFLLGGVIGYALFNVRVVKDSSGLHLYYNTTKVDTTSKSWKRLF